MAVTLAVVVCVALELVAAEVVVWIGVTLLMAVGILPAAAGVAPLGSVAVATVAALLVTAAGVRRTGVIDVLANRVLGRNHNREPLFRVMLPSAILSPFLNNTPIVAMFVPAILGWCKRQNLAPSRMLMPLSFATILGGLCTLIGTSTTLVVNGMMVDCGMGALGMFEIGRVGVPAALLGLLLMWLLAGRVLPDRRDPVTEMGEGTRRYIVEMLVQGASELVGLTIAEAGLRNLPGLFLMSIERDGRFTGPVGPDVVLQARDRLVFAGVAATVVDLRRYAGLTPAPEAHYDPLAAERRSSLYEVVVSASSPLLGTTIKDAGFRSRYDAVVIAVHRAGGRVETKIGEVDLRAGDTLMLEAPPEFHGRWSNSLDFSLVSHVRAEPPPKPHKAGAAIAIVAALVLAVALEWLPMLLAAMLGAAAMLLLRVLTPAEARRAIDLPVLVLLAGALGLGKALEVSGAATAVAAYLVAFGSAWGPTATLAAAYLCAALLTEFVTNVAAAAIVFPIAVAAAAQGGLDPRPFAIAVALASSASFSTPTGYQTNLMVYGPGGYRYSDFVRLGLPLQGLVFLVAMVVIPVGWPL